MASTKTPARPGTSLQGTRVSYYSAPRQGRVLTTSSGWQAGRQPGGTYQVRAPAGQQAAGRVPRRTWHRVVLAEFVATVLVIGATPFVAPQKKTAASEAGAAVATITLAGPLVRLTAACVIFFILALMATGEKSGKAAAAFGGLVLAGAMLNATGLWAGLAAMFGPAAGQLAGQNAGGG